jgi:NAD+ synthase (glutamine-hydrolysing)
VVTLFERNEYKRRQSPLGPKLTPVAFGRDWRFPVVKALD